MAAGGYKFPAAQNGKQPLDIELRVCVSWPEGSEPVFETGAVRIQAEMPADAVETSNEGTYRALQAAEEVTRRASQQLFFARRPRCLGCDAASLGFYSLGSLEPKTWPWRFHSDLFPVCGSCEQAIIRRAKAWRKKVLAAGDLRPFIMRVCSAKCGINSSDPGAPTFRRCSRCKAVEYCSKECQRSHWAEHKKVCMPAGSPSPST
ncbi:hypothetical protein DFJ74DRAFT_678687 [Hyaloraphidium curvatum]|nr:hypothetical protein DFJ74DRAFT_678687 [Hyaloraphidium curvatum]